MRSPSNAQPRAYDIYAQTAQGATQVYSATQRNSSLVRCYAGTRYLMDEDGTELVLVENPASNVGNCPRNSTGRLLAIPLANPASPVTLLSTSLILEPADLVASSNHYEIAVSGAEAGTELTRRVYYIDRPGRSSGTQKVYQLPPTASPVGANGDATGSLFMTPNCCAAKVRYVEAGSSDVFEIDFVTTPVRVQVGSNALPLGAPNALSGQAGITSTGEVFSFSGYSASAARDQVTPGSGPGIAARLCALTDDQFFSLFRQNSESYSPECAAQLKLFECSDPMRFTSGSNFSVAAVRADAAFVETYQGIVKLSLQDPAGSSRAIRYPVLNGFNMTTYSVSANGRWVALRPSTRAEVPGSMQFNLYDTDSWPAL